MKTMYLKMKQLVLLFIVTFNLLGCKKATIETENSLVKSISKSEKNINFDKVLNCNDFSYDEGLFITADYGCVYSPESNNDLGNIITYLIPNKKIKIDDDNFENENKRINNLTIDEYKKDFNIYIYI
jgi:hypothetical protein